MIILILFIICIALWLTVKLYRLNQMPPGPWGLPLIGSSLFFESSLFKSIDNLKSKYGKLFSFSAWGRSVIVLADYKLIREALLNRKEFSGRTTLFVNGALAKNKGISNYDGIIVDQKKKIIQRFLKMNENFVDIIDTEVHHFIDYISEQSGKISNPRQLLNKPICNIVWRIVFGYRVSYNDVDTFNNVERVAINNSTNEMLAFRQLLPKFDWLISNNGYMKMLGQIIQKWLGLTDIFGRYSHVLQFLKLSMSSNVEDNGEGCRVFEDSKERVTRKLSEEEKLRMVFELFAAGTDTTILSLQWACLILSVHPEIQQKMRDEINQVGLTHIQWDDRTHLRYCNQVVQELHRFASVTPLALPHRVTKETSLHSNYIIPENSILILSLYSIHFDPDVWKDPHQFRPERFDGVTNLQDKIMPFSIGKRACPGAQLAQAEIFCILTNLIHQFSISPANPHNLRTTDDLGVGSSGLTRAPVNHQLIFNKL